MSNQSNALRLADELLALHGPTDIDERAAAELRRLYAENEQITKYADALNDRCVKDAERIGLLLEALKYHQEQTRPIQKSIDAIKAAEENT